jgi:hypothetical protein
MNHHHDIRPCSKRLAVTRFLIRTVTIVAVMNEYFQAKLARNLHGFVGAAVIHNDYQIDRVMREFGIGHVKRLGSVVRRHDDHYLEIRLRMQLNFKDTPTCHVVGATPDEPEGVRNQARLGAHRKFGPEVPL